MALKSILYKRVIKTTLCLYFTLWFYFYIRSTVYEEKHMDSLYFALQKNRQFHFNRISVVCQRETTKISTFLETDFAFKSSRISKIVLSANNGSLPSVTGFIYVCIQVTQRIEESNIVLSCKSS